MDYVFAILIIGFLIGCIIQGHRENKKLNKERNKYE